MKIVDNIDVFLKPASVAVIGASERPGSWGAFMMNGLFSCNYPGKIYPVNREAKKVFGLPSYRDVRDIEGPVDLAILTIPNEYVEEAIRACGEKGVRGMTLITAGFGEAIEGARKREIAMAELARSCGMRLLGPNVSGTFNLHAGFNAAASPVGHLYPTSLAAVCQGGYAVYDLIALGFPVRMGVGQFIHTGNECDLTVTDFLEYFGADPEVTGIVMYLETIRDGNRFLEAARRVTKKKPVVVYKAGKTSDAARAASSHTGALAGRKEVFEGVLRQAGLTISPTMELLLPLAHAMTEKPPMRGTRVGIVTVGGSWGVTLSDALGEEGLSVPELSSGLQKKLRAMGMPDRASTKNPVDVGAAGVISLGEKRKELGRLMLDSGEVDALILHGMGRVGMLTAETTDDMKLFFEFEKMSIRGFSELEKETGKPVFIGTHFSIWESQVVCDLNQEGIRVYRRLDEIARILSQMHAAWRRNRRDHVIATEKETFKMNKESAVSVIQKALQDGRKTLTEYESKQVLSAYRIPVTQEVLVRKRTDIRKAAKIIGYPLVMKGCSPEIAHKTERGLIHVDIRSDKEALKAFDEIMTGMSGEDGDVLIQKMIKGRRELVMGLTRDAQFGPCVMFGLGGIFTEVLRDVSFRKAPFEKSDALDMLNEIKGRDILDAVRGMEAADKDQLADMLIRVGQIGLEIDHIREIDLNPVILSGSEPTVVDALIILK